MRARVIARVADRERALVAQRAEVARAHAGLEPLAQLSARAAALEQIEALVVRAVVVEAPHADALHPQRGRPRLGQLGQRAGTVGVPERVRADELRKHLAYGAEQLISGGVVLGHGVSGPRLLPQVRALHSRVGLALVLPGAHPGRHEDVD